MPTPKRLTALARATVTTALTFVRHFLSRTWTLTLARPTPNAITLQHSRYVTLTQLTLMDNLVFMGLLVRRVCEETQQSGFHGLVS